MSTLSQFFGGATTLPIPISEDAFRIDIVVVGGGGGAGAGSFFYTGGGGGRVIEVFGTLIEKNKLYTVTVGAGGPVNNTNTPNSGTNGGDSAFAGYLAQGGGTLNSRTGGRGGSGCGNVPPLFSSLSTYLGANPNDTSLIFSYGNSGGPGSGANVSLGGGGGAGVVGGTGAAGGQGGNGGAGRVTYIPINNGLTLAQGGGSGGGTSQGSPQGNGADNTGNAGGGNAGAGGNGGSGTVYVAYPNTFPLATTTGDAVLFSALAPIPSEIRTGYNVYQFRGSGTITFN